MISLKEFAKKHGVSPSTVRTWIGERKIPGATRSAKGGRWLIPCDAERPPDSRRQPSGSDPLKGLRVGELLRHRETGRTVIVTDLGGRSVYYRFHDEPPNGPECIEGRGAFERLNGSRE